VWKIYRNENAVQMLSSEKCEEGVDARMKEQYLRKGDERLYPKSARNGGYRLMV
jgi:hypothetical protein